MMLVIAALSAVVVVVLGFVVGVQPQLSAASTAEEQTGSVGEQNDAIRATIAQLQADQADLSGHQAELATLQAAVPATASLSAFIDSVNALAGSSSVTVSGLTTADAVAYLPAPAAVVPEAAAPTEGATAAPVAPAPPVAPELVTDPLVTSSNFSYVPVSVTVTGSYSQALEFLSQLRAAERLFGLTAFASAGESSGSTGSGVPDSWTVTGNVYVLQDVASTPTDATTTPTAQAEGDADDSTAAGE